MSRYLKLLGVALAAAALLGLIARLPRREPAQPKARAMAPVVALEIAIANDGTVSPEVSAVPKDHRVQLGITNRGVRAARVALAGYDDRLSIGTLAPGATWRGEFVADRPGEDLVWLVDGRPAGRFRVTGSHLVDGHR